MNSQKRREILEDALKYASTTKIFLSEPDALKALPGALKQLYPGLSVIPVADDNTWKAAGEQTVALLKAAHIEVEHPYMFPGSPMVTADHEHSLRLSEYFIRTANAIPLAIGSGTINDLVKLGAHLAGRPYACVATASSVDGYASDGAALLTGGSKLTHSCPAPSIIIGDTDILNKAPKILASSGYADLMAKIPAGADWIVADFLGEDPINPVSWKLVQTHLRTWLADPSDSEAVFIGLTLCGIAMQYQKTSRPVAGAEHLLSHIWEMEHHTHNGETVLHGIKVGIGTLISTAAYEVLLSHGCGWGEKPTPYDAMMQSKQALLSERFKDLSSFEQMQNTLVEKHSPSNRRIERRKELIANWNEIMQKLQAQLIPYGELRNLLNTAGCPVRAEDIGMGKTKAVSSMRIAQLIRNRYDILDILDDLGLMDKAMQMMIQNESVLG